MILDSRIKEGKRPLTCLDIEQAQEFVGKKCIFSDSYDDYRDIEKYNIETHNENTAILKSIKDDTSNGDYVFENSKFKARYRLILPLEWVKKPKKKYRPYTLAEWIGQHAIGDVIRYRCKSQKIELRHMYVGYAYGIGTDIKNTTSGTLTLGVASYTMDYLLEDYELEVNGEWLPFGMIDE